jgi:glycosyltransferase involved in cell wall biosynthesis
MKILYLVTKSNWGGAQKYVYDLATAFSSRKCDIVVAFGGRGELATRLEEAKIRTVSLDSLVRDIDFTKEIKSSYALYRLLQKENPDVLHVNSSKAGGLGAFLGRILGIKCIVFTVHGAPFREDLPFIYRALRYFFTWVTCLFAHKVIAVSNQDAHDLGQMFSIKKKITTIYPGIVFDGAIPRVAPKTRETHILTVAELHPNKGYLYGLPAIEKLHAKGIQVRYTIFGEGDDRKKIEEYIHLKNLQNIVTLAGSKIVLDKEGQEYDIFLLPSIKEGLPYTLIEAGKAMLPVISSITGGIPEIIRHEETGLLVQPKDVQGLASAIERLITDRKFAKKLGIELHSHVVQNFSHSKMLAQTAQVYGLIKYIPS